MADGQGAGDILVQVCLECGKEYMFEGVAPPDDLTCEKCGGTVFRSFDARTREDDVSEDFRQSTERDTATDDPATDVTRGDLLDLGNL
jgi:DNA-directed RNA polymerase subunit RPC12/RpoP